MKKRHIVTADAYTVSSDVAIFSFANKPIARILLSANGLHANIQGTDDHLPVKKAGVLNSDTLNWLIVGFGPDDRLARLVLDIPSIDLSDLYRDLSSLFERADVILNRIPPSGNS